MVKPYDAVMPKGPMGGAAGTSLSTKVKVKKKEDSDEDDDKSEVKTEAKTKAAKKERLNLFRSSPDEADSESEDSRPSRGRRPGTTLDTYFRPKPKPAAPAPSASSSSHITRAVTGKSPPVVISLISDDEDCGQPTFHRRGRYATPVEDDDGDEATPPPLELFSSPGQGQSSSMGACSTNPSSSPVTAKKRVRTARDEDGDDDKRAVASTCKDIASTSPSSHSMKRLKIPRPSTFFEDGDYESSPTAYRSQRSAAAQATTKLAALSYTLPTTEDEWEEEQEFERQRGTRRATSKSAGMHEDHEAGTRETPARRPVGSQSRQGSTAVDKGVQLESQDELEGVHQSTTGQTQLLAELDMLGDD
ncbi:hypothetical protein BDZ90DRAFT_230831 [Jaminaea rosea]|uniref:Uncharacterized protein n=1 Tax=Jaminaea rosea TaxID=1569628 RepID=A0A316UUA2_9BASI|nr:hypothetical protein BDZ90DRAFT_230831 [Jaminaea rosea]PWN28822.1 hypothetical protein BDZ90DRAFT_230831 [Jaminaea rosea]